MPGNFSAAEIFNDFFCHANSFVQDDKGTNFLSVFFGWDGGNLYIFHAFQMIEELL